MTEILWWSSQLSQIWEAIHIWRWPFCFDRIVGYRSPSDIHHCLLHSVIFCPRFIAHTTDYNTNTLYFNGRPLGFRTETAWSFRRTPLMSAASNGIADMVPGKMLETHLVGPWIFANSSKNLTTYNQKWIEMMGLPRFKPHMLSCLKWGCSYHAPIYRRQLTLLVGGYN